MTSIMIDRNDGLSAATAIKGPCRAATTANITLSGLQTVDGVSLVEDDRVLVIAQTDPVENGIYVVDEGPWRRAKDFSGNRDVRKGTRIYVTDGTTLANKEYIVTSINPVRIGTDDITLIEKPVPDDVELPTTASRYVRRNDAGTDYEALTAQQSANIDVLRDIEPGASGQDILAAVDAAAVWAALGAILEANLPGRLLATQSVFAGDMNTKLESGWVCSFGATNQPEAGEAWLYDIVSVGTRIVQTAIRVSNWSTTDPRTYVRVSNSSGSSWTTWTQSLVTQAQGDARYCKFYIQAGDPGAVGAGSIWVAP